MARVSRPPGFDMTYKPAGSVTFNPPLRETWYAWAYLVVALVCTGIIIYGQTLAPSTSKLFRYIVEGDQYRAISSTVCVIILMVSALAGVIRSYMQGVVVHPDGVELRELLPLGLPRIRRYLWSQIDRVMVPGKSPDAPATQHKTVGLDLWDGSRMWLPTVSKHTEMAVMIEKVALARAIPIEGGTGLIDDLGNPADDE